MIASGAIRQGVRPGVLVLVLALASAAVYLFAFTLTWPLWRFYAQPQADYSWFGQYARSTQAVYLGAFALLFALQYVAYRVVRSHPKAIGIDVIVAGQML